MGDKLREECGVFGIFNRDDWESASLTYYALFALQHRGQESCGIAINDNGTILCHKDVGLVPDVFDEVVLNHLMHGKMALGHCRYAAQGQGGRQNAQPLSVKYHDGSLCIAYNGSLVNADELRKPLEDSGAIFQTTTDSELIVYLLARERLQCDSLEEAVVNVMKKLRGSYAVLLMSPHKMIAFRDPNGLKPLAIGELGTSQVFASESVAFDAIGATLLREVCPGEVVVVDEEGVHSLTEHCGKPSNICIFEYIYFARPDSVIEGISVHEARKEAGRILAREHAVDADLVIGVPDSGISASLGYAEEAGIPYETGLIKNRYIGRTFIQPKQSQREQGVMIKLNALRDCVAGKRVVMVDDSIVRGTTCGRIVRMLKEAGATEVHVRISSPPFLYPCYFGTDVPDREHLVACNHSVEDVCKMIGADSLGYLSLEGTEKIVATHLQGACKACFNGNYPIDVK